MPLEKYGIPTLNVRDPDTYALQKANISPIHSEIPNLKTAKSKEALNGKTDDEETEGSWDRNIRKL